MHIQSKSGLPQWGRPPQCVKKALLQGVPPPAGGGIKFNSVIFGDMRLENDTSHDGWSDFSARNRTPSVMQLLSKKAILAFFDNLREARRASLFSSICQWTKGIKKLP